MTSIITVEGMSCAHCEETVEAALRSVDGVSDASANRDAEQAEVEGDADVSTLVDAVEAEGYSARP